MTKVKFVTAVKFHYRVLQLTAVFLTPLGVTFILLMMDGAFYELFLFNIAMRGKYKYWMSLNTIFNFFTAVITLWSQSSRRGCVPSCTARGGGGRPLFFWEGGSRPLYWGVGKGVQERAKGVPKGLIRVAKALFRETPTPSLGSYILT